ncbi:hypothetical protein [Streptomyces sp. ITFR-16]|uniref:hypothetical protein n=1 Tax=Streptomyces sp. ITFR-16 TaxID=3075198 RepID=UPI00288965FB|nr:hypothetical protein [Streptomyces sp. ITFR-16]WNI26685.1 hypothetical protein RLT58_34520 [Streptomyces sp. ITFR-16]
MTDEEFEKLMAQACTEADRGRLSPAADEEGEYAMLARHAEFGASAHLRCRAGAARRAPCHPRVERFHGQAGTRLRVKN